MASISLKLLFDFIFPTKFDLFFLAVIVFLFRLLDMFFSLLSFAFLAASCGVSR